MMIALCFVLVCCLVVGGTYAYQNDPAFRATVKNFVQGFQQMAEGWIGNRNAENGAEQLKISIISSQDGKDAPLLMPGSGPVSITHRVKNGGEKEVYFRLYYAVQYNQDTWDKTFHVSFVHDERVYDESDWYHIMIDGTVPYLMKVFTYKAALSGGTDSPGVTVTVEFDGDTPTQTGITQEQFKAYRSDFLLTQVMAIDTEEFTPNELTTYSDALNAALPLDEYAPF